MSDIVVFAFAHSNHIFVRVVTKFAGLLVKLRDGHQMVDCAK
jgi:hypothetical protein